HFTRWGPQYQNPGRGWLMVERPGNDDLPGLLEALWEGRFYASSGLELGEYHQSGREVALELNGEAATMEVIGPGGRLLESVEGQNARFALAGLELPYVRVRAVRSNGARLWMQPLFR